MTLKVLTYGRTKVASVIITPTAGWTGGPDEEIIKPGRCWLRNVSAALDELEMAANTK